jgi:hypothetical protein
MATEKLKENSQDVDQIRGEHNKAGDRTICSEIQKHIICFCNKELPEERKESINVPMCMKSYKRTCSNYTDK